MKRQRFFIALAVAVLLGGATSSLGSAKVMPVALELSASVVSILSLALAIESKAYTFEPWHFLLLGPFKASTELKPTKLATALWISCAYVAGLFIGIAWLVRT